MTTKLREARGRMDELAERHYQLGGKHADNGARNCDCELAEQFRLADHECEMLVARKRTLADLDATCEAFERGRLQGLEEAAKLAEDHKSWKKLIPPNHGVANVTVAGLYVAKAIREKIKGAAGERGRRTHSNEQEFD